jgi:hypothetical protein
MSPAKLINGWPRASPAMGSAGITVAFFLLLLWRNPHLCWNDDFALSILPVFVDIGRAWSQGEWPLLSPYSWACGNLAGEFQYGTFSLFVNLTAVAVSLLPLTLPAKAAALSLPHLAVLAAGATCLAQRRGAPALLSCTVGVIATLNGWNIGWGATNWFGAIAANAWLPWCWWAFENLQGPERTAVWPRSPGRIVIAGIFVYLLVAGGFPYTVLMIAVISAWLGAQTLFFNCSNRLGTRISALWPMAASWLVGLGLSAPAWLSLLDYIPNSDRAHGAHVVAQAWTLPWSALPGLVIPAWTSHWRDFAGRLAPHTALELAGGLVPLALIVSRGRIRKATTEHTLFRWDLALVFAVLVLCALPSASVFRWSFRWLPLLHLALSLAAVTSWSDQIEPTRSSVRHLLHNPGVMASVAVTVVGVWMLFAPLEKTLDGVQSTPAIGWTLVATVIWALAHHPWAGGRHALPLLATLVTLWITYYFVPTNPGVPIYRFRENLTSAAPLAQDRLYLSLYREPFLHYRQTETPDGFGAVLRPGSTSLIAGVPLINGYSPIMAAAIGRTLAMDTHGNVAPDLIPDRILAELKPGGILTRVGVDGLIVANDLPHSPIPPSDEWIVVHTSAEGNVYHRRGEPWHDLREAEVSSTRVVLENVKSGRLRLSTDVSVGEGMSPAQIAVRRPFFAGYAATLDGRPLRVHSDEGLFPIIDVPAGSRGRLLVSYSPRAIRWGTFLVAATLGALLLAWGIRSERR